MSVAVGEVANEVLDEVREGDYCLQLKRLGDRRVEWALVRKDGARGAPVIISGEADCEQDAIRRGRLQLRALGLVR